MIYHIQFQVRAIDEYEEAALWYRDRSQRAAEGFLAAVREKLDIVRIEPARFRKVYKEYREVRLKKYPFKIIYVIKEENKIVAIASVFHLKRNPRTKFKNLR